MRPQICVQNVVKFLAEYQLTLAQRSFRCIRTTDSRYCSFTKLVRIYVQLGIRAKDENCCKIYQKALLHVANNSAGSRQLKVVFGIHLTSTKAWRYYDCALMLSLCGANALLHDTRVRGKDLFWHIYSICTQLGNLSL